jgi:protein-tyrosine phosphatase
MIPAGRLVELEGCRNFRDLGGYPTADGRQVRWGRVFRADALGSLTAGDLEHLTGLGLVTICDLRGPREAAAIPDVAVAGAEWVSLPMGEGDADHGGLIERVASGELPGVSEADMVAIYASLIERFASQLGQVVTLAADRARLPLVFHCAAGKDRTGLAAAVLLGALGVSEADILDDYELTNRYRSSWRIEQLRPELAARGVDIEVMRAYFSAPRGAMVAALEAMAGAGGSMRGFLEGPGRVDPGTLDRLGGALLEPV